MRFAGMWPFSLPASVLLVLATLAASHMLAWYHLRWPEQTEQQRRAAGVVALKMAAVLGPASWVFGALAAMGSR